ncbi:TlpA family protein disulfide reductase [Sphingobacterium gobiense]|uniref:Thioredoxin domain-containing protein n=1 Tax=Sphingobacterium gobiense TaxID=1382456 RepID=A0A2S9JUU3_9SPHI|nr:TlpA disulfide reductase family protein [Sphingobacterium gobiense]PRD57039.1 hypothetical protein C5749_07475 [Sphingobacterium gobiense]
MQQFYANGLAMPVRKDRATQVTVYPPRHIHNQNVLLQDPIKKIVTTRTGSNTKLQANLKTRRDEDSTILHSATVRQVVGISSKHPRDLFDTFSDAVREVFECCSGAIRRTVEAHPKDYRRCPEPVPKRTRSASEGHPNTTRRNSGLFCHFLSKFKAGIERRPSDLTTTQAQPKNDLRITQQRPKDDPSLSLARLSLRTGYRQGSPKDDTTNTQETANNDTRNVRLMYRESTVSVRGVYRKGTGDLLRSYWRSTKDPLNACTSGVDQRYSKSRRVVGVEAMTSKVVLCLRGLGCFSRKLLSLMTSKNKAMPFMAASLCFSRRSFPVMALKNKGVLLYGLLCFMLFNLSTAWAQSAEPRTAEGQSEIKQLEVGQKVPDEFWRLKHSFLEGSVIKEGTLEAFKGKVLLLDFWETYCSPCLKNFPTLDSIQETMQGWGEIVLVNEKFSGGTKEKISASLEDQRKRWDIELAMTKIIKDEKLRLYFKHLYIPHYVLLAEDGTVLVMGSIEAFDAIRTILEIYSYNNNAIIN